MSHIARVKSEQITNEDTLRKAVARLAERTGVALSIVENARARYWGSQESGVCDLVIKLPGHYDLGLKWIEGQKCFQFVAESSVLKSMHSEAVKILGYQCGNLLEEYQVAKALEAAENQGLTASVHYLESGDIQIVTQEQELEYI